MIKIKLKEKIKLLLHFSQHQEVHHASAVRSDLCYRLQHEALKLRRQNQGNRIKKKNKNKDEIQIILKKALESWISKDQVMEFKREDDKFQMESISLCG